MRHFLTKITAALGAVAALLGCGSPPYPHGSVDELFAGGPRPQFRHYEVDGRRMEYAIVEHPGAPRIVFIHGSPGSWKAFAGYLDHPALRDYGARVAPDRPGYGDSGAGEIVPGLREQARLLAPLLDDAGGPAIVVGHSLGGAHALQLAMDYPEKVRGVLLIAASVAPELEAPRWYNRAATWHVVQWLIPDEMVWSNLEIHPLQQQLQLQAAGWARLRAPVYAIQGMKDRLVDPRSVDYLEARLQSRPHRIWRVEDQGHFIIWERMALVTEALQALVAATAPANDQP